MSEWRLIKCSDCNRGGNGNDKDKCACGWQETEPSALGCYSGTPIIGERKTPEKVSASKARYKRYLEYGDGFDSFRDFLKWDGDKNRSWNNKREVIGE